MLFQVGQQVFGYFRREERNMELSPVDGSTLSLENRRQNSFLQHSLVFKDQADKEIVCVNHVRATLACFETCRKYYLPCPLGKIVKHRPKITRVKWALLGSTPHGAVFSHVSRKRRKEHPLWNLLCPFGVR